MPPMTKVVGVVYKKADGYTVAYMPKGYKKTCSSCNQPKLADQFHKCTAAVDGKQGYCKNCAKAYGKGYAAGKKV